MKAVIIVAILFVACNVGSVFGGDPCQLPGSEAWIGTVSSPMPAKLIKFESGFNAHVRTLQLCFSGIPFSEQRRFDTVGNLRQLIDFYAFTDLVKNSGAPWNLNVDLDAGLTNIENKNYDSDYEFHSDLVTLFNSLNDAHTVFRMPRPYYNAAVTRPFGLQVVNENGQLKFYLTESYWSTAQSYSTYSGFNPAPYFGGELTAIDGTPILDWFKQFVDKYVGYYKDQGIRFNAAIEATGQFGLLDGSSVSMIDLPDSCTMTIDGTDVDVPYLALLYGGLASTNDAITKIDTPPPPKKRSVETTQFDIHRQRKAESAWIRDALGGSKSDNNRKRFEYASLNTNQVQKRSDQQSSGQTILSVKQSAPQNLKIFVAAEDNAIWWGIYTTTDGADVPFLRLATFLPDDEANFTGIMTSFANYVSTNQIDQVIVDVSGNGGGYVCLFLQAISMFSEKFRGINGYDRWDLRRTDSNADLVQSGALISLGEYLDMSTEDVYEDNSFYDPRTVTRGGQQVELSQQFYFPASCIDNTPNIDVTHFPADPIIITDGTCGSACSMFTSKFVENNVGRVFSYGGFPGTIMDTASFGGGNVEQWNSFVNYYNQYPLDYAYDESLTSATYSFTHNQAYSGSASDLPREFKRMPGQYHAYYYDVLTVEYFTDSGLQAVVDLYETAVGAWLPAPVAVNPPTTNNTPQTTAPGAAAPGVAPVTKEVSTATSVVLTGQAIMLSIAIYLCMLM